MNKQKGITEKELGQVFGELLNPDRMAPKRIYRKTVMGAGLAAGLVSMLLTSGTAGAFLAISNTSPDGGSNVVFRVRGNVNPSSRLNMGDAKTTGARYLNPRTPANREGIDIEGDESGLASVSRVEIFNTPPEFVTHPLGDPLWLWIHRDSVPVVDVLPWQWCPGPVANHNCVPKSFQVTGGLPGGADSGFYTSTDPTMSSRTFPNGGQTSNPFTVFFADAYGSTFWAAVKVRSEARWLRNDGEGETGIERLYGAIQVGVYLGPLLPQGAPPEITPAGTNVWEVAFGSWSKPKGVGFAKRRIVTHLCKSKTAGQEKSADVNLKKKHGCEVVDEQKIGQKKGRVSFRLDIASGQFLVVEDWLYLKAENFKSENRDFVDGKERVSGRTFEQRQAFVEEIPLMPFVTRSDSVAIP